MIGGSPLRIMRLTAEGARLVDQLAVGEPVPRSVNANGLVRRLLDGGLAHPRPNGSARDRTAVTIVIPVRDGTTELAATLSSIGTGASLMVVDDGSRDGGSVEASVAAVGGAVRRHEAPRGPAAARNTGWRAVTTELVAFVDAGCRPAPGWLERLLPHFDDAAVAAVAPRITTSIPLTLPASLGRYESARPALDRGEREALVRPRGPVPFVPTAALVVRRDALEELSGFDERLRFGEDVDFVWRLVAAGKTVRYEPGTTVVHPARPSVRQWLRQRFNYGSSVAPLALRHGRAVAPLAMSPWTALAWALTGLGQPVLGATVAAGTTAALARRLDGLAHPWAESLRLAGAGHLHGGTAVADALRRTWWPLAVLGAIVSPKLRRGVVAAAVVPSMMEWNRDRLRMGLVSWIAFRLLDDVAYGAGVWAGSLRERSWTALRPDLTSWPGREPAIER
jgi:mycofactocin system glycosyltransferase